MIELTNVTKDFGTRSAVNDVSFAVRRGEIIGLLGPNGSGKTTLMRIITGFFPPSSGQARVAGFDAGVDRLALRRCIGYLPENVVLYPEMGVRQFLGFCAGLRRLRGREARDRIGRVLESCSLVDVATRPIGKLSKGYRQRVGLAQALLHDPQVLILDEPTVGLDPRQVTEMRQLVAKMRGRATVLLSTHILSEVTLLCDRVIILDRGRVVAEDTTAALGRRVAGDERTLMQVDGPPEAVRAVLAKVAGVTEVRHGESGTMFGLADLHGFAPVEPTAAPARSAAEKMRSTFVVHHPCDDTIRAVLAAAIVSHGWQLRELRPLPFGMEELFLRLVGNQPRSDA